MGNLCKAIVTTMNVFNGGGPTPTNSGDRDSGYE